MAEPQTIRIFDTTLRDGEQSPGASLNTAEKLEIARALELLNVDIIEAGFPIASPDDFGAVRAIADEISGCTVAGLARSLEKDVVRCGEAVKDAAHPRIHVFCATSAIHREFKLKRAKDEIIRMSIEAVKLAKTYVNDVEFSPEDASRTEPEFLAEVVEAVIAAGAVTVNIPDTVGYATPDQFGELIAYLKQNVSNIDDAVISVHCHNDLGLAVANSLAAVRNGARQIECTINGLGERAGNASLEEIVMALNVRQDFYDMDTRIDTGRIYPTSRLVSSLTGMHVQRNKAIVGENAFAHEAGIHQHGVMEHAATYEIMRPQDVGVVSTKLVLGKHSGRHALRERLDALGISLSDEQLVDVFERFKALADKKKEIFDEDIEAIVGDIVKEADRVWELVNVQTVAGGAVAPTATVKLRRAANSGVEDETIEDAATGDGPVDAVYSCIQRITGLYARLTDYHVRAVTDGRDAQGEANVELEADSGRRIRGRGHSTDIIEASALAYVSAINRILAAAELGKQKEDVAQP
jgi:2-isopropylmalate synthase